MTVWTGTVRGAIAKTVSAITVMIRRAAVMATKLTAMVRVPITVTIRKVAAVYSSIGSKDDVSR